MNDKKANQEVDIEGDGNVMGDGSASQVIKGGHHEHHYHCGSPGKSIAEVSPNLPPKAYHRLVGRFGEMEQVMNALRQPERKPIVVIVGMGGIGKTALAREVVDRCGQEDAFDHIVWVSAKTERFVGEKAVKTGISDYSFEDLLGDISRQCGHAEIARKPALQKLKSVKRLLASNEVLIVMDNLETVPERDELVGEIFHILGRSKLLITSRHRVKHERAFTIDLEGFPEGDGVRFLREEARERGIDLVASAKHDDLAEVYSVTGGAPLAMKLIVGQVSRLPLEKVLEILTEAEFEGQDYEFYRFVFKHSWDILGLSARKVLVSMSAFAQSIGGTEENIQRVSGVEDQAFYDALDQLVLMSLVDSGKNLQSRRYTIHQLTYYFILSDIVEKW